MPQENIWTEVTIITTSEAVEAVSALLYDAGVGGVAIEDPKDIYEANTKPGSWDYIDEKLMPPLNGEVKVKGYFPNSDELAEKIAYVRNGVEKLEEYGLNKGKGEITTKTVQESDWANAWKQYYKPFKIGKNIIIKPTWEGYVPEPNDIVIEIDPGMAFGTGTHESTRMCAELLEEHMKKDFTVFDIGCGSGILSIIASKLGASSVTGVDIDEVAVKASRDNVTISGAQNVNILHGNLLDVISNKADIIVANIIADVIMGISGSIPKFLTPGGLFISSGIIRDRADDVKNVLIKSGFRIMETREMGEWVAVAAAVGE